MKEFSYTIKDVVGIHARPAGMLVKTAAQFKAAIEIRCNDKVADAKKIFSVMSLGAKYDDEIHITANGDDEDEAIAAMETFVKENI